MFFILQRCYRYILQHLHMNFTDIGRINLIIILAFLLTNLWYVSKFLLHDTNKNFLKIQFSLTNYILEYKSIKDGVTG